MREAGPPYKAVVKVELKAEKVAPDLRELRRRQKTVDVVVVQYRAAYRL